MALRNWRIYARLDSEGNPYEFSYVGCLLEQTKTFVLWEYAYGTWEDAQRAVRRNEYKFGIKTA